MYFKLVDGGPTTVTRHWSPSMSPTAYIVGYRCVTNLIQPKCHIVPLVTKTTHGNYAMANLFMRWYDYPLTVCNPDHLARWTLRAQSSIIKPKKERADSPLPPDPFRNQEIPSFSLFTFFSHAFTQSDREPPISTNLMSFVDIENSWGLTCIS